MNTQTDTDDYPAFDDACRNPGIKLVFQNLTKSKAKEAHADKLAELCSRLTDLFDKHSLTPHENGKPRHDLCVEGKYLLVVQEAKAALAAYEEAQGK